MPTTPPRWYEVVIGTALMAVSLAGGWHLLHWENGVSVYVWIGVGVVFALGAWSVIPYRAHQLLGEIRRTLIWWRAGHRGD
jgi:hypothetical protein